VTKELVLFQVEGPIATITLNRPEKLNALTLGMLSRLEAIAAELEQNREVRVLLLAANGRAFCVGADIHAWTALEPLQMWRQWIRDGQRVFARIAQLPQPVIAVLHGYTFGGGLELALAADLRLAAEEIQLGLPEVSLGTVPGWSGTQRLPALIGAARAKQMILTGGRIDAATAERWGLVNEGAPPTELHARALVLAGQISRNAPAAVQLAKQLVNGGVGYGTGATLEALAGGLASTTEDLQEGLAAFNERRPPNFAGK
jgi:enoyl-CoA hydratase